MPLRLNSWCFLCALVGFAFVAKVSLSAESLAPVKFESQTVDAQVAIGYGIALEDVDGDKKTDIVLADKREFVWYRNPDWKRFVLARDITEIDNVCIAARDINGDGRVEIAVGARWNPGDTVNSGSVHYLIPPDDRTQPWKPIVLPHEPVVHRMAWVEYAADKFALVVSPLHGRGNQAGQGAGARLLAYYPPDDPAAPWRTELLDDTLHVTHNFDRAQWVKSPAGEFDPEELLYLGREAALLIRHDGQRWRKHQLVGVQGGGEIRMGRLSDGSPYVATIEPFHGDRLALYRFTAPESDQTITSVAERVVLDDNFQEGHAIATGDLLSAGYDQIIAGWRVANRDGKVGVKWYGLDATGKWQSAWIDDNTMACEDARLADLDGDGRLDVVAAGRATHNLKIYWNRGVQP